MWAEQNPTEAVKYSPMCGFRGKVIERVNNEKRTYYECICRHGYMGMGCSLDVEMFNEVSKFIKGLI